METMLVRSGASDSPLRPASSGAAKVGVRSGYLPLLLGCLSLALLSSCTTRLSPKGNQESPPAVAASHYAEVASQRPMGSSVPEVFDNGPAIKAEMLELVASAEDYLLISSFLLTADSNTREILEALQQKQKEGVRIYVLADSCARYKPGGKPAFQLLENSGIQVAEFNPIRLYKIPVAPAMLPRDHRKFWIVDGKTLFLGGANLYANSLKAPEKNGNLDLMVSVESPEAIERMIESFVATWNRASKRTLSPNAFAVPEMKDCPTHLWLSDQNRHVGSAGEVENLFDGLFRVAQEEVWLIQPYTFVTPRMLQQFRELSERGVEVNVMLSSKVEAPRFHYASHYGIKEIQDAGGKVWIYDSSRSPLHSKAVIVDRQWATIGSANLNLRSYKLSKEANLVFGDEASVAQVVECLEKLKSECREVSPVEAADYRGVEYGMAWILMQWLG